MEKTKKCPFCGKEVLVDAHKCKHCGQWIDKKCPNCGQWININAKKCRHCGNWIEQPQTETISQPVENEEYEEQALYEEPKITPPCQTWIITLFFVLGVIGECVLLASDDWMSLVINDMPDSIRGKYSWIYAIIYGVVKVLNEIPYELGSIISCIGEYGLLFMLFKGLDSYSYPLSRSFKSLLWWFWGTSVFTALIGAFIGDASSALFALIFLVIFLIATIVLQMIIGTKLRNTDDDFLMALGLIFIIWGCVDIISSVIYICVNGILPIIISGVSSAFYVFLCRKIDGSMSPDSWFKEKLAYLAYVVITFLTLFGALNYNSFISSDSDDIMEQVKTSTFSDDEDSESESNNNSDYSDGKLYDLLQDGNTNLEEPEWKSRLVNLVGKDNYEFMCEQYMGSGPTEDYAMGGTVYTFEGSTKENWDEGYTVTYSIGGGIETLSVEIRRNGDFKTYEETKELID